MTTCRYCHERLVLETDTWVWLDDTGIGPAICPGDGAPIVGHDYHHVPEGPSAITATPMVPTITYTITRYP